MTHLYSKSPTTGNRYRLPDGSDKQRIDQFVARNANKKVVVVQGLGFVGTAMALVVANSSSVDYAVIGIDRNSEDSYWKIGEIINGICPVKSSDPLFAEYFDNAIQKDNFLATYDEAAFEYADVVIVDVNLDVTKVTDQKTRLTSFDVPLDGFQSAIRAIGDNCKEEVLILVETTVPPGTCQKIVLPLIRQAMKKRGLSTERLRIGHSYERVMPGPNYINSIKNFYRVYSGVDDVSASEVENFLTSVISTKEYPLTRLQNTESTELAKVLENSYRALNIAFAIEWTKFAETAGVNLFEVIDAIRQRPTHANLMYPGIGVGGYCLTKDPLMASWASTEFFGLKEGLPYSVQAVKDNDDMPRRCFQFVSEVFDKLKLVNPVVGLCGVAYGPGVADTRFSPVERFLRLVETVSTSVLCHDPLVDYWPELNLRLEEPLSTFLDHEFDVIIVTTAHSYYVEDGLIYKALARLKVKPIIIDTVGILDLKKLPPNYDVNNNFFVLGVG